MVDEDLQQAIPVLQREHIFHGLDEEQIRQALTYFEKIDLPRNSRIFSEGDFADSIYVILKGKVGVAKWHDGKEKLVQVLKPGDFFGEQALFTNRNRATSAFTIGQVTLLRLDYQHIPDWLAVFPLIESNLMETAESRAIIERTGFSRMGAEEVVHFVARKHDLFLYLSLIPPLLLFILSFPTIAFALTQSASPSRFDILISAGIVMFAGSIFWAVWNWLDWENDYYLVSNQRVLWIEKVIGIYESRREAPLDAIQAVNIDSSQLGRILDYGNVNVRTYTGGFRMRNVKKANLFGELIDRYSRIAKEEVQEEEKRNKEQVVKRVLYTGELPPAPLDQTIVRKARKVKSSSGLREKLRTFLKVRYKQGNVITYRKHWFLLVQKSWLALLGLLGVLALESFLIWTWINVGLLDSMQIMLAGLGLIFLVIILGVLAYQYWDWSNDIYQLTPDQIFDIEKKPLGQEMKKTANLDKILSIEHERGNLIGILLNFGTVVVNIGETRFIFIGVHNPDQVHQDISEYREALKRKRQAEEQNRARRESAEWLSAYHREAARLESHQNQQDEEVLG